MSEAGDMLRDEGIAKVSEAEPEAWKDEYILLAERLFEAMPLGTVFSGATFRDNATEAGLPEPHHWNVWSAMSKKVLDPLHKANRIEDAGAGKAEKASAHSRYSRKYRKIA